MGTGGRRNSQAERVGVTQRTPGPAEMAKYVAGPGIVMELDNLVQAAATDLLAKTEVSTSKCHGAAPSEDDFAAEGVVEGAVAAGRSGGSSQFPSVLVVEKQDLVATIPAIDIADRST